MSMSTLAISYLTMSNLPWFMDLTFQVPVQHCSLLHWTLLSWPDTSTTERCFCFCSTLFLELFSPLFPSSILDTYQSRALIFQCHIFLSFHSVHGVLEEKNTGVVCHSHILFIVGYWNAKVRSQEIFGGIVVQGLVVHSMQGAQVWSVVRELDPICYN